MNISNTSRALIESERMVITTLPSYAKSLKSKAANLNKSIDVIIVTKTKKEETHASS